MLPALRIRCLQKVYAIESFISSGSVILAGRLCICVRWKMDDFVALSR